MITHHVGAAILVAILTQAVGTLLAIRGTSRAVEAFSTMGAPAAVVTSHFITSQHLSTIRFGRRFAATVLVFAWSARLGAYLWLRNRPPKVQR